MCDFALFVCEFAQITQVINIPGILNEPIGYEVLPDLSSPIGSITYFLLQLD